MKKPRVVVDPEIEGLLGPLSEHEAKELEADCIANGIAEPLVLWGANDTLLDGHNRFRLAERHELDYFVRYVDLPDRAAAIEYVLRHQLARRNLTPERYAYYRGQLYNREKKAHGGDKGKASGNFYHLKTSQKVSEKTGVSEKTVRSDGNFATAVDAVSEAVPEAKAAILDRKVKVSKADVKAAAEAPPKERKKFAERVVKAANADKPERVKFEPATSVADEEPPTDELGNVITSGKLISVFASREHFDEINRAILKLRKDIKALAETPAGRFINDSDAMHALTQLSAMVRFGRPYAVHEQSVNKCGWVTEQQYKSLQRHAS